MTRPRTPAAGRTDTAGDTSVLLDGTVTVVPAAISIAAAVALSGRDALRTSQPSGTPRAVFCGMGSCQECLVTVDGVHGVRACITPVVAGMRIDTHLTEARDDRR